VQEISALEQLQERASMIWDSDRPFLLANPGLIVLPPEQIRAGQVRVAVDGDALLGFSAVLALEPDAVELDGLFVDPDQMRRGIGAALVADVVAIAREGGAARLEVTANRNALAFYERNGFAAVGEVPTQFLPGLRMHLVL
jgi:ribosomal protein S18 acetylase RimI-like enzyme